jgi:UDP-2,3-diacylglucosamine pyrophosphatase LpxH
VTTRVLVAGDVHLGAANANVDAFNGFLDDLSGEHSDLTELVLLGDVWDLIRRDPFGCAWETTGTIRRLRRLAERVPVRLVVGNHDSYLRALDVSRYRIDIRDEYVLSQGGTSIRFCHGHAFDRFQFDPLSRYLSGPGDLGEIDPTRGLKDSLVAGARRYALAGAKRLSAALPFATAGSRFGARYPRRERRAHAFLETVPEDKLVYGHTHAPYVHHENVAANPGSWKSTAPVHNTYLEIVDGSLRLFQYRPSAEDERVR